MITFEQLKDADQEVATWVADLRAMIDETMAPENVANNPLSAGQAQEVRDEVIKCAGGYPQALAFFYGVFGVEGGNTNKLIVKQMIGLKSWLNQSGSEKVARIAEVSRSLWVDEPDTEDDTPAPSDNPASTTKAPALTSKSPRALTTYGDRETVRELADRLKFALPGGQKLKEKEILALAQASVATGLDPILREIWYIPGIGPYAGIEGHRRAARLQSPYTTPRFRAFTADARVQWELDNGEHAVVCEIHRFDVLRDAVQINLAANKEIASTDPYLGYGVVDPPKEKRQPPKGKSWRWLAELRAEREALKKAYDLGGLRLAGVDEPEDDDYIEGHFEVEED